MAKKMNVELFYQRVGQEIREIRKGRKMSQMDFAMMFGLDQSALSRIETGKQRCELAMWFAITKTMEVKFNAERRSR